MVPKALVRLALAALLIYAMASQSHQLRIQVAQRDSIAYWASGRLLLQRANPYDPAIVLDLEREQQYQEDRPLVLRTPPWSLFMVLPLGLVNAFWAWLLWIAASLASLILTLRLCLRLRMRAGTDVLKRDVLKPDVLKPDVPNPGVPMPGVPMLGDPTYA
jgi:hypothetical protein